MRKTILLPLFVFLFTVIYSQPDVIELTECMNATPGIYTRAFGHDILGCPCYEGIGGVVFSDGGLWKQEVGIFKCEEILTSDPFFWSLGFDDDCNILDFTFSFEECTISESQSQPVPTLSQWGLFTLSLIILIIGLVVVRQRKVIFG